MRFIFGMTFIVLATFGSSTFAQSPNNNRTPHETTNLLQQHDADIKALQSALASSVAANKLLLDALSTDHANIKTVVDANAAALTAIQDKLDAVLEMVPPPEALQKIIFVSSGRFGSDLGGLGGADDKCRALAENAGLEGQFLPWLSTESNSPANRFTQATVPYVRTDGFVVADNWTDLTDGSLKNAIDHDENGNAVPAFDNAIVVWSATNPDGTFGGAVNGINVGTCGGWTGGDFPQFGAAGNTVSIDGGWTDGPDQPCDFGAAHLVCVQQ